MNSNSASSAATVSPPAHGSASSATSRSRDIRVLGGACAAMNAAMAVASAVAGIVATDTVGTAWAGLPAACAISWVTPAYGGNPVGARRDRFELIGHWLRVLGWVARSDRGARPLPVLPPRMVTVALFRDRLHPRTVSVVNYHLVPGVQSRGGYRPDRPLLVERHTAEVQRLNRLVAEQLAAGHVTFALGDSNFDGFRIPGLTSAWQGREDWPGTLGSARKIDDVFGPGPAIALSMVNTASDHKAVLTRHYDTG